MVLMKSILVAVALFSASINAQTCVATYGQCGGQSYTGSTTCCSGSVCTYNNQWYSQCLPGSVSSTSAVKTTTTSVKSATTTTTKAATTTTKTTTTTAGATPTSSSGKLKYFGVNLAGAEFGNNVIPGVLGTHYVWPDSTTVKFFTSAGMNVVRLPILWERLQPTLNGAFATAYKASLDSTISLINGAGAVVIVEPHNFGRFPAVGGNIIGSSAVPNSAFNDFWTKVASAYKGNSKVWFNLMNEPNTQDATNWAASAQGAINAIRAAGSTNTIIVPGVRWTGAWTWTNSGGADGAANAVALKTITDSANNFYIEVHQYLDSDGSGTSSTCVSSTAGADRLATFTAWARTNGFKAWLGEMGASDNTVCVAALTSALTHMEANKDVYQGFTYWAAGAWWPTADVNEIQPQCSGQPCKTGIWNALKAHI